MYNINLLSLTLRMVSFGLKKKNYMKPTKDFTACFPNQ